MSNTYVTSTLVGQQIVQSLHARTTLPATVNTSYAKDFAQRTYVPGETVTIELDDQPNIVSGLVANVRDRTPITTSVTIAGYNTSVKVDSLKLGYSNRVNAIRTWTDSMVKRMNREIERTGFQHMAIQTAQQAGTVGTETGAVRTYAEVRAKIDDHLAENDDCYAAVSPSAMVALADALKGAPNPSLSNSFVSGRMKNLMRMNFYQTPSLYRYTAGTTVDLAGQVNTTSTTGATTLVIKSLEAGSVTITAGTKFTVAAVYDVDPETKVALPYLKEFSMENTETTSSNAITADLSEAIYGPENPGQQNVSALPLEDAVVTIIGTGTASTKSTCNMVYDKDAFTLVSLPLPLAQDGTEKIVKQSGLTFRVGVSGKDHINDTEIIKVSALWGWGTLRPFKAGVVWGA